MSFPQPPEVREDDRGDNQFFEVSNPVFLTQEEYVYQEKKANGKVGSLHFTKDGWLRFASELRMYRSVSVLETLVKYRDILRYTADPSDTASFHSVALRLVDKKIREIQEGQQENTNEELDISSWMMTKGRSGHWKLTNEGKAYAKQAFLQTKIETNGIIDEQHWDSFVTEHSGNFATFAYCEQGKAERFSSLIKKSFEMQKRKLNEISTLEYLQCSNNPWNTVVETLVYRLYGIQKQSQDGHTESEFKHRKAFVMSIITPVVEKAYDAIRSFEECDVDADYMLYLLAEKIQQNISKVPLSVRSIREFISYALETDQSLSFEDQIQQSLMHLRIQAECSDALIQESQNELDNLARLLNIDDPSISKADKQKIIGDFWKEIVQEQRLPSNLENTPNIELMVEEFNKRRKSYRSLQQDQEMRLQQKREIDAVIGQIRTPHDAALLLESIYIKNGQSELDVVEHMLMQRWIPLDLRLEYQERQELLLRTESQMRQGVRGTVLEFFHGAESLLTKLVKRNKNTVLQEEEKPSGFFGRMYEKYLYKCQAKFLKRRDAEENNRLPYLFLNSWRLFMVMSGLVSGAADPNVWKTTIEQPNASFMHHSSEETNAVAQTIAAVIERVPGFVNGFFNSDSIDLQLQGQMVSESESQARVAETLARFTGPEHGNHDTGWHVTNPFDYDWNNSPDLDKNQSPTLEDAHAQAEYTVAHEENQTDEALYTVAESSGEQLQDRTAFEYVFRGLYPSLVAARAEYVNSLTETGMNQLLETIGGAQNLEGWLKSETICLGIVGMDNGGSRNTEYGRSDQVHLVCLNPKTNTIVDLNFPRHLDLPEIVPDRSALVDDVSSVMWKMNPSAKAAPENMRGPEILREAMIHASGLPVDGIITFSMDGAAGAIDALFPKKVAITIGEGESFRPRDIDLSLGQLTGKDKNGHFNAFEEGKTYEFNGYQLIQFLRSRQTSANGSFAREERWGGVLESLITIMMDKFQKDLPNAAEALIHATQTIEQLEQKRSIQVTWGLEVDDPDAGSEGTRSRELNDVLEVLITSLKTGESLGALSRIIATSVIEHTIRPKIQRFSISPYSSAATPPELRTQMLRDVKPELREKEPPGQPLPDIILSGQVDNRFDPVAYWTNVRAFFQRTFLQKDDNGQTTTSTSWK